MKFYQTVNTVVSNRSRPLASRGVPIITSLQRLDSSEGLRTLSQTD
jgi:hypothetical protein